MKPLGILTIMCILLFLNPFLIQMLWLWFVTPMNGITQISYPQAMGLALLFNQFGDRPLLISIRDHILSNKTEDEKYLITLKHYTSTLFSYGIVLLIAYIAKGFM